MTSIYGRKGLHLPRLQHVSLPVSIGGQAQVREFYGGVLGLEEKTAPAVLAAQGIIWFAAGENELELHFIPDGEHLPHPKEGRHICLEVADVALWRVTIEKAGYEIIEATPLLNRPRFFCHDPFGNRLEFTAIEGDYLS